MKLGAQDFIVKDFGEDFKEVLGLSLYRVYSGNRLSQEKLRLERETALLRVAIENSADGLAVIKPNGMVGYANGAFREFVKLCGGNPESIRTIFSEKVSKYEVLAGQLSATLDLLTPGGVWQTEVTFAGDPTRAYELSLSRVGAGTFGSAVVALGEFVVWVRDITEAKRREKFQREILSTTTHDLKGPLGAILLSHELLLEAVPKVSREHEIALRIGSSAQGAINLIDEFLSARRIQEGTFILKPKPYDLRELIEAIAEDYKTISAAKRISLEIHPPTEPTIVSVDKIGLTRVVGNLLSNALKFTPRDGKVSLRVLVLGSEYQIAVEDSGCGMEPAEVKKIFGRFSRLEKHSQVEGTGLGLFVVKSIVAAHGGSIQVTSAVGRGTTFIITLPISPPVNERGEVISLDFA